MPDTQAANSAEEMTVTQPATDSIVVIIASAGRPDELGRWIDHIARQTYKPTELIWAITKDGDRPQLAALQPTLSDFSAEGKDCPSLN